MELNNKNIYVLQIDKACVTNWGSFVLLQIRATLLLKTGAGVVKNWESYYKLG